jgi:hypothetical protein
LEEFRTFVGGCAKEGYRIGFLAGAIYADGFAKETGSIVRGFKRGSNDAFLEPEIRCIWVEAGCEVAENLATQVSPA